MGRGLAAVGLTACIASKPPIEQPAPTQLAVSLSPSAVVQAAAQVLAVRGFTVTVADAAGGILTGSHSVAEGSAKDWLSCRLGPDAVAWRSLSGSISVTVTARQTSGGSSVVIVGAAHSAIHSGSMILDTNSECVSSGDTERRIAAALVAP